MYSNLLNEVWSRHPYHPKEISLQKEHEAAKGEHQRKKNIYIYIYVQEIMESINIGMEY